MSSGSLALANSAVVSGRRLLAWAPWLLAGIYLLSGASGLVYQVLWQRMLALVFGVSTYATATVLAAFMGGLALGGFVAGRLADRSRNPLRDYGRVEVLIGVSGFVTPWLFGWLQDVYRLAHASVGPDLAPIVRFILAVAVLLVPTALMGASFPFITRAAATRYRGVEGQGTSVAVLYAVNTFGALAGATVAGFYLIGAIGIAASIGVAALLNVAAGVVALAFSRSFAAETRATVDGLREPVRDAPGLTVPRQVTALMPAVLAVSGFCSLAYEVVWTRLLVLFLETTTAAFTVMLAAFLAGIAAGSALVAPLIRTGRLGPLAFGGLQALVAVLSVAGLILLGQLDRATAIVTGGGEPGVAAMAALAFCAMFPPALVLGITFPLGVALYSGGSENVGSRLGSVYAANVCGAIFGALVAGFALIPRIGTLWTLLAVAGVNLAAALVMIAVTGGALSRRVGAAAALTAAFAALVLTALPTYRDLFQGRFPGERIVWTADGLETTVTVTRERDRNLAMYLNRHHQANTADWMVFFHRMLGHLPMLLHPAPRDVLVVGLGGGATAGATTRYEGARVTVVELSGGVIEGAGWFRDVNYAVTEQPNVQTIVDDGRNFLLVTDRKFDVITADAIWPTHAGATNLYSTEYYALARAALKPGGVMVQWVNRDLPEPELKMLMRTFVRAFPHVSLWFDGSLLAGSDRPIDPALPWLERKLSFPLTQASLAQVNLRNADDVRKLYVMDRASLEAYLGEGPVISDDRPHLEYTSVATANSGPGRRPIQR
ncbi:MAG: fused MFS/spermidine synthase [Chloroflexota bacterium]